MISSALASSGWTLDQVNLHKVTSILLEYFHKPQLAPLVTPGCAAMELMATAQIVGRAG